MNRRLWRWLVVILAVLNIGTISLLFGFLIDFEGMLARVTRFFVIDMGPWRGFWFASLLIIVLAFTVVAIVYAIIGSRFKARKTSENDLGFIKIGSGAIENIALNAAKTAQAGIKTAHASVFNTETGNIRIELDVVLYSDVEIPQQMRKIQERVKKDIERYTGMSVDEVVVNVKKVELVGTLLER